MLLSDVCLSHTSDLSGEQRPKKTKIGTEIATDSFWQCAVIAVVCSLSLSLSLSIFMAIFQVNLG